jgi:hypothetical protein
MMPYLRSWRERKQTEDAVETHLRKRVKRLQGLCLKLMLLTGFPDRLVLLPGGRILFFELKRPKGGKFEPRQPRVHKLLRDLGFRVYVCKTKDEVDLALVLG